MPKGDSPAPSVHVSLARAVNFLVDGEPLEPIEHAHLLHCNECRQAMVEAALEELQKRNDGSQAG